MEQPPPLTPEEIDGYQYSSIAEPQTVKIFGVLHVVFGIIGIFALIWTVIHTVFGDPFDHMLPSTPELARQQEVQAALEAEMLPATILTGCLNTVVTILILIAGAKLLKKRRDGLISSNRYAKSSLGAKVIGLALSLYYSGAMVEQVKEGLGATSSTLPVNLDVMMIGGMVVGAIFSCLYPVLSLILLNRPATKDWFAAQPR